VPYTIALKNAVIAVAYIFVFVSGEPSKYSSTSLDWFTCIAVLGLNGYLFYRLSNEIQRRNSYLYCLLGLDLLTVFYLFFLHGDNFLMLFPVMVAVLGLVVGFYSLTLPSSGAIYSGSGAVLLCWFSAARSLTNPNSGVDTAHVLASLLLATAVLLAVMVFLQRIKKNVDEVYTVTDDLAYDLSHQAVDSELAITSLTERNREIKTLLAIVENFVAVLDFDELFENIVTAFRNRFDFEKFTIYLYNNETDHLDLRLESGGERGTGVAHSVRSDYGMVGWCFTTGEGVMTHDVTTDPRFAEFNPRAKKLRSLACQPLIIRGERLGVLCLDSERVGSFDEQTFAFLESVSPLISLALSNCLHYGIAKEESLTDNLTKLLNHRGFMEAFLEILAVTYTSETPCGVIIIDIDHFKRVNDAYGHLVGNVILVELAAIFDSFFRGSDLVARYGGEEFIVVLRGTPPEIAPRIAEQLRRKVESHQFPISLERDAFMQVTISQGVATTLDGNLAPEITHGSRGSASTDVFLRNAQEICEQIIENADQALYAAKEEGRNQVMLSAEYPIKQMSSEPLDVVERP
jgi:diguanylate cyclase (GGDEF)-like protein